MMNFKRIKSLLLLLLLFSGCRVHKNLNLCKPTVCIPEKYEHSSCKEGEAVLSRWWREFNSHQLNHLMEQALSYNLTLKESWFRVAQSCALARIANSQRFPEITTTPTISHFRTSNPGGFGAGGFATGEVIGGVGGGEGIVEVPTAQDSVTLYLLANSLSYEVDLWRKIDAEVKAACNEVYASKEDLESTAWMLTGAVTEVWLTILEQKTLLDVINHQIEVSKTQLELIELRYSVAESSALDVYQQRLQLQQTTSEKPPVESQLATAINQLYVLLGFPPGGCDFFQEEEMPDLPAFPYIGKPVNLLMRRPDLRAEHRRLIAADYEVAVAIADRFPRLELFIDYDLQATKIADLLTSEMSSIIATFFTPIFDGGRRRAEVKRRKAIVCERLNRYGGAFLDALLEVEDALIQEKYQIALVEMLTLQLKTAKINLKEAEWHYLNGLNDYLTVIAAIQSQQNLERRIVTEKKELLAIRARLYRALGGSTLTCYKGC